MNQVKQSVTHEQDFGTGKKTFGIYFLGFLFCVILTLIPFWVVIHHVGSTSFILVAILATALLQFFVQLVCFLRLNTQTEQGLVNILSFVFTGVVLLVVIGGSVWIMTSLNYFMMH